MNSILIIDDVPDICLSIRRVLEPLGFTVYEAYNGIEGLKILEEKNIDLLITDVVMPAKNGLDLILELKNRKDLKIIIITGNIVSNKDSFYDFVKKYGIKFVLHKPFRKSELINAVKEYLGYPVNKDLNL